MNQRVLAIGLALLCCFLASCTGGNNQQDLRDYIAETKRRPKKQIEPMPSFLPYEAFTYAASRLRSPFDRPVAPQDDLLLGGNSNVKPDFNRPKEILENFNLASLTMVGIFQKAGRLWVLIDDGEGTIHPVTVGNYLGKNHGKIVAADRREIKIVEIVTDGLDGWVERPQTLKLAEKD